MKLKHSDKPDDREPASPATPSEPAAPEPPHSPPAPKPQDELRAAAEQQANIPLWKDFAIFLLHNKKWWLLPIILILLVLSLLMAISSTAISPFIYTIF